jgi:hypothetical protein
MESFNTSKDSIRKYRQLLLQLGPVASNVVAPSLHLVDVATSEPGAAATIRGRPLLSQDWLACHLPGVREVRVVEEYCTIVADDHGR